MRTSRGRQRVTGRDLLDLHEHDPAGVLRRLRHRERVQGGGLALHRHVAVLVGRRAAQERHVDRRARVEEVLLAVELDEPDDLLGRRGVHPAAVHARVDERAEPDARDQAGAAGGRLAIQVRHDALRQAVGLDPPLQRQRAERGDEAEVAADHAPDQPFAGEVVEAARRRVSLPGGEYERQPARRARLLEALGERRRAAAPERRPARTRRPPACRRRGSSRRPPRA